MDALRLLLVMITALALTVFYDHKGLIVCPTASPYVRGMGGEAFPRFKAMIDAVLKWKE